MNSVVLIPAYQPGEALFTTVDSIMRLGIKNVIVVDDGSRAECGHIFSRLEALENCHVLRHAVNLGKGRALKTGFNYFLMNFKDSAGLVTADADGQHLPGDIVKIASAMEANPGRLILGARQFGKGVPLRSLIGNLLTKYIFYFLVGKKLSDTQTGLRGLPRNILSNLIKLEGEGYEYEMNVLISTKVGAIDIVEQLINTVYIENNKSSHFNPLLDSMKIYLLLIRFSFSSLFASVIDFLIFTLTYYLSRNILMSICCARLVAANINFFVNKSLVFRNNKAVAGTIIKYYSLVLFIGGLAYISISALAHWGVNVIIAKILVESLLFIASFSIQRDFIFTKAREEV